MKLVVTIPSYNEEASLGSVIREIPEAIPGVDQVEVLVVDDGSTDLTVDVAQQAGADRVISHKRNMGLAKTFRDGLNEALSMGADIIVNIDADFQYNAGEIPKLIAPLLAGEADIVIGDRQIDALDHMPRGNLWGNKIATWVTRRTTGLPIRDAQTGFRAFSREAALQMNLSGDYTYVQETLIQAANKDLTIVQVPVEFRKRTGESRLISSLSRYARSAGITIFRSFGAYHPFTVFSLLGIGILLLGFAVGSGVLVHYLRTGMVTPHFPSAVLTTVLILVGLQTLIFGLLADMLRTQRLLSEEVLYHLKKRP